MTSGRSLLVVAAIVPVLAGCGSNGASGAPKDASKDEFCAAYTATPDLSALGESASPEDTAKKLRTELQRLSAELSKTGTPTDIPADARRGFEVSIDAVDDLDEDDLAKAIANDDSSYFDKVLEGKDRADADAFDAWAAGYCG